MLLRAVRSHLNFGGAILGASLVWMSLAAPLPARVYVGARGVGGYRAVGYSPWNWGWGGGYGGYNMETPAQGAANMMQAAGEARESTSRAMINLQEANKQYIENEEEWNKFYWERRAAYKARQAEESAKERESVQKYNATKQSKRPPQLTSSQLDAQTGTIHWPLALQGGEFEMKRKQLDELFAARAHTGSTPELAVAIKSTSRALQSDLRDRINDYTTRTNEYLEARKFLESLSREGEYHVD